MASANPPNEDTLKPKTEISKFSPADIPYLPYGSYTVSFGFAA